MRPSTRHLRHVTASILAMRKRTLHWLSPGPLEQRTGGYIYNARMIEALRDRGWNILPYALPGDWPTPTDMDLEACAAMLRNVAPGSLVIADGLLWPGLGDLRMTLHQSHTVVVLVHSFLDQESAAAADHVAALENRDMQQASGLLCTSPLMARMLADRVPGSASRTMVVCPGTDAAPPAPGSQANRMLCVSTITSRKGIRNLIAAVASLDTQQWRLDIAGSLDRDPDYARTVAADIDADSLADRVTLHGEVSADALGGLYGAADVLVHAARFEAFGMALAEAAARRIPIVSTPAGALEILPAVAYEQVPAEDARALAERLALVLSDHGRLRAMRSAAATLPAWADAAATFENSIADLRDQ